MKKITYLLSTLLIVSCTDNGLIDTEQLENIQPSTRAVGDGKYDALGYGYNCFYADFSDPLYVQGKVIDIERLEEGRGRDQITKDELSFTPAKINEAIYPKIRAAEIPTALAVNPPIKIPIKPFLSTASFTPCQSTFPKPRRGTLAPEPAKSWKGP